MQRAGLFSMLVQALAQHQGQELFQPVQANGPEWQANPRVKRSRREYDFTKGKRGPTGLGIW